MINRAGGDYSGIQYVSKRITHDIDIEILGAPPPPKKKGGGKKMIMNKSYNLYQTGVFHIIKLNDVNLFGLRFVKFAS